MDSFRGLSKCYTVTTMHTLTAGNKAPLEITVQNEQEQPVSLKEKKGTYVVLYFYPRDNTPGCTTEACSFRDTTADLKALGVEVIGVSADSVSSHEKFKQKHKLPFELWSDPEKKLIDAFGALGEKKLFGKTYIGIKRITFALNPDGVIIKVWSKVSPQKHGSEVLNFFKEIISKI